MIKLLLSIAVTVMVAGAGVGIIAQEAKPGDMLYGFKTVVNEGIAGLFATEYTAQVDFEVSLLQERLEEIDELVLEGKLSAEDAVYARAQVLAQLEKTQAAIAGANNQTLTAAQKARISASLTRLQTTLATYRDSLTTLDAQADAAVAAKPQLSRGGGSRSKSIAAAITEAADAIGQTAEEVLDTVIDIADEYITDEDTNEEVEEDSTDSDDVIVIDGSATSTEETMVDDDSGTTSDETSVEVETETEADLEVDMSEV